MVGAHHGPAVPGLGLQFHQDAVPDLVQRLQLDATAGDLDRADAVAGFAPPADGLVAQLHAFPAQQLTLIENPVVVHPGQQLASVLGDRRRRVPQETGVVIRRPGRRRRQPLRPEDADVDPACRGVPPGQCRRLHHQGGAFTYREAQVVQLSPQVRARLGLVRVRPEDAGQVLSVLRHLRVQDEVRQQRDGPR